MSRQKKSPTEQARRNVRIWTVLVGLQTLVVLADIGHKKSIGIALSFLALDVFFLTAWMWRAHRLTLQPDPTRDRRTTRNEPHP